MQTLQIILTLANITCYGAMTFLAVFAFVRLKRQEKYICDIHRDVHTTLMLTLGLHIMAKTLEQIKASGLAMDIQEFTSERPECNDMSVEDFVFYLLDFARQHGLKLSI